MITVSVPGSLLLLGEYCILEQGMKGLSLGVAPKLFLTAEPASRWTIIAQGAGDPVCFSIVNIMEGKIPLIQHCQQQENRGAAWATPHIFQTVLSKFIECEHKNPLLTSEPYTITIDSSSFYYNGKKLGLGSSAGVVVVWSAFLFLLAYNGSLSKERLLDFCISVHKIIQQGRGSGYDVLTSILGNLLFFSMSEYHSVRQYPLRSFDAEIICALHEVKTPAAIDAYEAYKKKHPVQARIFCQKTQSILHRAIYILNEAESCGTTAISIVQETKEYKKLLKLFKKAGKLSENLGNMIGVPAVFPVPSSCIIKCLGAGNEMALAEPIGFDFKTNNSTGVESDLSEAEVYKFSCVPSTGIQWEFT